MRRRSPVRMAATVAAWLLVSVVAAACGGGGDKVGTKGSSTTVPGGSTTSSMPTDPSETTIVAAAPETTVKNGTTPATTSAPAVTAPPATDPPGPVALAPAAPGTYRYATSGATTITGLPTGPLAIPFPPATVNIVDPPAGSRQHSQRRLLDASGNGSIADYTFDYRPDGVYLASVKFTATYAGQSSVQDLTPPAPLLFLATGAGPGSSQTLTIPTGSGNASVVVEVPRTEVITVGGQALTTLVVRTVATLPAGAVTGTQSLTVNLDPGSRVWVREVGVGDGTAVGMGFTINLHSDYTARIESLTPG